MRHGILRITAMTCTFLVVTGLALAQSGRERAVTDATLIASTDGAHAGTTFSAALTVRLKHGYHVNANKPLEEYLIPTVLTFDTPEGIHIKEIVYPEAVLVVTGGLTEPLAVYEEEFVIGIRLSVDEGVSVGEKTIEASMRYQACDEKACYRPTKVASTLTFTIVPGSQPLTTQHEDLFASVAFSGTTQENTPFVKVPTNTPAEETAPPVNEQDVMAQLSEFTVLQTAGGFMETGDFLAFIDAAESGEQQRGVFEGLSLITILFLIVAGGLALNLTPCVLPLIPINLAIIGAGAQSGSRMRGFALGGTYGLAMAFVYGLLGLIVILTAGSFGTINASPWFNIGIAALFIVLGLGMFDVIPIDFSKFQSRLNLGSKGKGTFALAFAMGAVAALLAGACVAPVVIQVIIFSSDLYAKGTAIALALPFFLGIGMALPWPFAGAGLSFLPKPGAWMVRVKQAFGVFIFAFAAYYGYLAYEIVEQRNAIRSEVASDAEQAEIADTVEALLEEGWVPSLSQGLAIAKAENKPVLVDMWATWCKNCLVMDRTTLNDPEVVSRLEGYVKVKYQAEDPGASPTREVMQYLNGVGLPNYAILEPPTS